MPTENAHKADNLIDVGEADQKATEINLDNKGEPEKIETPVEEKIEVEQVEESTAEVDKSFENERETKWGNNMTYDELQKKVSKLLEDTEDKMTNLIEEYNESIEDKEDENEIDTVDLHNVFDPLNDYIEDYTQ